MESFINSVAHYWAAPEISANIVAFMNIFGALMLGLVVGYERSYRGRAAGMRTYGLVCMASCALTVIAGYPEYWFGGHMPASTDPTRVIQGVITGIGFLGAGVIMRDGLNISGLTTAASIWTVAAIGVLVGVGFHGAAIMLAILAAIFMMWGAKVENLFPSRHAIAVTLHFQKAIVPSESHMRRMFLDHGYEIARGSFAVGEHGGMPEWRFVIVSLGRGKGDSLIHLGRSLSAAEGVESFHLSHARN